MTFSEISQCIFGKYDDSNECYADMNMLYDMNLKGLLIHFIGKFRYKELVPKV